MKRTAQIGLPVLALLLTSLPALAEDTPLTEEKCSVLVTDASTHRVDLPSLHVLDQVSSSSLFALPKDAPSHVTAIMCGRSSPVPSQNDYKVLLAGLPLFIVTGPKILGGPNRMVTLEMKNGRLSASYDRGILTKDEERSLQTRIDAMQLAIQASP